MPTTVLQAPPSPIFRPCNSPEKCIKIHLKLTIVIRRSTVRVAVKSTAIAVTVSTAKTIFIAVDLMIICKKGI
jgi:hypothetical protein